jgi:hypothetical protein
MILIGFSHEFEHHSKNPVAATISDPQKIARVFGGNARSIN